MRREEIYAIYESDVLTDAAVFRVFRSGVTRVEFPRHLRVVPGRVFFDHDVVRCVPPMAPIPNFPRAAHAMNPLRHRQNAPADEADFPPPALA